jgi:ribosomal-protein-alanine N-acetyltransferase
MRWTPHKNIDETRATISNWNNSYDRPSFYQWAITLKDVNIPIGAIGLFVINEYDLTGDVGYCIGKAYWGRGIATEALRAILYFAYLLRGVGVRTQGRLDAVLAAES